MKKYIKIVKDKYNKSKRVKLDLYASTDLVNWKHIFAGDGDEAEIIMNAFIDCGYKVLK